MSVSSLWKPVALLFFAGALLWALAGIFHASPAPAANGADFQPGNIISDGVFTNANSMSVAEIQSFLNAKVPVCDTNGTKPSEYGGGTRAQYGTSRGYPPPYICLKNYTENGLSAAQIIYNKSQEWGINPRVLIVLLQKEQRLVSDDWPWSIQYRSATGYGCPDTAACDSTYYGFTNQVHQAAKMYREIINGTRGYNYYPVGSNSILWHPNSACGRSTVSIVNGATSALYNYTPYRPNADALNNLYGFGDSCSAYGNRNFWRDFTDWFGSTHAESGPYAWSLVSVSHSTGTALMSVGSTQTITIKARNIGTQTWKKDGANPVRLGIWDSSGLTYHSSWIAEKRPATFQEAQVAPGEIGTFTFTVTVPYASEFLEGVGIVAENLTWLKGHATYYVRGYQYSWEHISTAYSRGSPYLPVSSTQTVTIKVRNTGQTPWTRNDPFPVRLGVWFDSSAATYDSSWIDARRPGTFQESVVPQGGIATFSFSARAPTWIGPVIEHYRLVAEGLTWMNDPGLTYSIEAYDYTWQLVSVSHSKQTAVTNLGETQTVTIKAKNTGGSTWTKDGTFPVRLGVWWGSPGSTRDDGWLSPNRPAALQEATVAPGATGTFSFPVRTPYVGEFLERVNLVAEGVAWFNDVGAWYYLRGVNPYAWQLVEVSHSKGTAVTNVGETQMVTIKAKNTGGVTWTPSDTYPVRLGWYFPFPTRHNPTWLASNRPLASFSEPSVAPGGIATFSFTVTAPYVGEFLERVNLVAEGLLWFPDQGAWYYIRGQ